MKILNLYSGIGGNRKLWGNHHDITAVELNEETANIYKDYFPNDKVIVSDAHQYLLEHYKEFDFIWSSPPCPSHSRTNYFLNAKGVVRFPDMKLYEEIIFLNEFFKGKYIVENVISYYSPLIEPQKSGRHYFWANFKIPFFKNEKTIGRMCGSKSEIGKTQGELRKESLSFLEYDLSNYQVPDKDKLLRNCVDPKIGKAILDRVMNVKNENSAIQVGLFQSSCE